MLTNKCHNKCASSVDRKDVTIERDVIRFYMFIRYYKESIDEVTDGIPGGPRMNCTWKSKEIREKETLSKLYGSMVGRDNSVSIATRYGLDGPGNESRWGARFSEPVRTGPGSHPASYGSFPGVKWPGRDVDHPPHLTPRLKKE
jgi:hypothetical protein